MFFNRAEFKSRAKKTMQGRYWRIFAACVLVTVIVSSLGGSAYSGLGSGIANGLNFSLNFNVDSEPDYYFSDGEFIFPDTAHYLPVEESIPIILLGIIAVVVIIIALILFVVGAVKTIFICNPLMVGLNSFFLSFKKGENSIKGVFDPFTNGRYMKTVKTVFLTDLIVSLWSLLLFIPGVYFGYSYSMVKYICAENPDVSSAEARRLSKLMTDGYKFRIFVIDLSFIGWILLGTLTIVGIFFVEPYYKTTITEMYLQLRDNAIASGKIKPEELGLTSCGEETVGNENL